MLKNNINQFELLETPFYAYDMELLRKTLLSIRQESERYGFKVHYAMKANSNDPILEEVHQYGFGADCVSGNEVQKALKAGFSASDIVFAGVGKTDKEIETGLKNDIFCFNCESIPELEVIHEIARSTGKIASVALRINPDINANTHHYITTGLEENKFGMNKWELEEVLTRLRSLDHLKLIGLHFHIGSQITDLNVFKGLCLRINEIQDWFYTRHIIPERINVGGGLGVNYENPDQEPVPDFQSYFGLFRQFLKLRPGQKLHFELGRSVVAQCGSLISRLLYVKKGVNTNFAIIDAGMTELLRPALYQAYHKIEVLKENTDQMERYDVVGPICESSDCFGKALILSKMNRGDLLAIRSVGAYGEVMSSNYNLRDKVKAYYFDR